MTEPASAEALNEAAWIASEAWAKEWWRAPDGADRLASSDLPAGWAMHIEIFDAVLPAVLEALGSPPRVVGRGTWRRLKRRGWDRGARAWGLRALDLARPRSRRSGAADVLFVSEQSTPSALDASLAVAAHLHGRRIAVGVADPRALRRWRMEGLDPHPLILGLTEEARYVRAASRKSDERWRAASSGAPRLDVGGRDLTGVALGAAEPIVRRSLGWLDVEALAIRRLLERTGAHTVVIASDQHRIGRLTTHVARAMGTRSIVLQHGLPQATLGYVPVAADVIAVWSDGSARWFEANGTPRQHLAIVGNPRLDSVIGRDRVADREATVRKTNLRGTPAMLLALSVAPRDVNLRVLEMALDALHRSKDARLIVKLHPGGSDWRPVTERLRASDIPRDRVHLLDRSPLYPLLGWADVVVVHRSTVAGEALAAGRPVIVVEPGPPSIAAKELVELELPRVSDGLSLAAIAEELADAEVSGEFLRARRVPLEATMGSLDGRSGERAAALTHRTAAG